jgi:vitamin B12 transporter
MRCLHVRVQACAPKRCRGRQRGFIPGFIFMKIGIFGARLLAFVLVLFSVAASHAQTQLKETVVTATRTAKPVGDVVADVTIIDKETIERSGAAGLADVLARVPGVEFYRNGGVGNQTNVLLRGGESRHTMVLVDGVRVDSQSTSGGATWSSIPLSQIDHIEVVRGPSSAVYGSGAVAGVIQIFTKKGGEVFSPSISYGYGTFNTQQLDLAVSGMADRFDYSLGVSGASSDGFNVRPIPLANPDADGYLSNSANIRLGLNITPSQRLEATVLQSRMDAQIDGTATTGAALTASRTKDYRAVNTFETQSLQWMSQWTGNYNSRVGLSHGVDKSLDLQATQSTTQTVIDSLLWFNEYKVGHQSFTAGLEQRDDAFQIASPSTTTPAFFDKSKSQTGTSLGYAWSGEAHTVQLSARNDVDSEFGGKTTTSAAYAYALTPQWRVSGSSSTSFRVPTLYQRFHPTYGVATLAPESGRSVELGLKYAQATQEFGVVVYRNAVTDLLTFVSGTGSGCRVPASGCYVNVGEAVYRGVTVSARKSFGEVGVWGSLDLQEPRDAVSGKLLARRATHHATLGLDTRVGPWTWGADMVLSALRYDDAANNTVLPGYVVLNVSAQRRIGKDWTALVRVDNANDATYQLAKDYATSTRTLYVGLKWAP